MVDEGEKRCRERYFISLTLRRTRCRSNSLSRVTQSPKSCGDMYSVLRSRVAERVGGRSRTHVHSKSRTHPSRAAVRRRPGAGHFHKKAFNFIEAQTRRSCFISPHLGVSNNIVDKRCGGWHDPGKCGASDGSDLEGSQFGAIGWYIAHVFLFLGRLLAWLNHYCERPTDSRKLGNKVTY